MQGHIYIVSLLLSTFFRINFSDLILVHLGDDIIGHLNLYVEKQELK